MIGWGVSILWGSKIAISHWQSQSPLTQVWRYRAACEHQTKSKRLNKEMPYSERHQINHNSTKIKLHIRQTRSVLAQSMNSTMLVNFIVSIWERIDWLSGQNKSQCSFVWIAPHEHNSGYTAPSSCFNTYPCWLFPQRDKDDDSHSGRGRGRGLHANVNQSPLSGRGYVTALDQSGPYDVELSFL